MRIRPVLITALGLALEAAAVWGIMKLLEGDPNQHYWLVPIFGAIGGAIGGLLPHGNDNQLVLCDFEGKDRLQLGVVGDVALGLGGASAVFFLFSGELLSTGKPVLVSASLISGVFGRQVLLLAGAQFVKALAQEEGKKAAKQFLEMLKIEKGNAISFTIAATDALKFGDHKTALVYANNAIGIDPRYARAYAEKARALRGLGKLQEALAAVEDALRILPNNGEALYNRACYKCLLGHPADQIITDLAKAFETAPRLRDGAGKDPDLQSLHQNPKFQNLLVESRNSPGKA